MTEHTLYQLEVMHTQSALLRSVRNKERALILRYSDPQGLEGKDFTQYYESL